MSPNCSTLQWRNAVCPTAVVTFLGTLKSKYGKEVVLPFPWNSSSASNIPEKGKDITVVSWFLKESILYTLFHRKYITTLVWIFTKISWINSPTYHNFFHQNNVLDLPENQICLSAIFVSETLYVSSTSVHCECWPTIKFYFNK